MNRKVSLAIGIGDAPPLDYLSGAINGARAFHAWAMAQGYDSILLIDDEKPVTMSRLQKALTSLLAGKQSIHRLLLYFAGHGLIREAEEGLWLLSDWNQEQRAVAVEVLRRRFSMYYDIQQIAIFADACRSVAGSVNEGDLTRDAVLGRGPCPPAIPPAIDKFIAAQDGGKTFVVPGESPEEDRCIFSGVLMEGLWGTRSEAFSKVVSDVITSRSLGSYLQSAVPLIAARYGRKLVPNVSPTFPEGDDIYLERNQPCSPPQFRAWPPPEDVINTAMGRRLTEGAESIEADDHLGKSLLSRIRKQPRPNHFETHAGFAMEGGAVRAVWTTPDVFAEISDKISNWWRVGQKKGYILRHPAPVLIEFEDGMFAAVAVLPEFVGSLLRSERGISALVFRPVYAEENVSAVAEMALAALESGNLRADALADLTIEFRRQKHTDPVLGVISAYLYDSIGDISNIRRMAYYYTKNRQPVPYDIALLGQLPVERRGDQLWAKVPAVPSAKATNCSRDRNAMDVFSDSGI